MIPNPKPAHTIPNLLKFNRNDNGQFLNPFPYSTLLVSSLSFFKLRASKSIQSQPNFELIIFSLLTIAVRSQIIDLEVNRNPSSQPHTHRCNNNRIGRDFIIISISHSSTKENTVTQSRYRTMAPPVGIEISKGKRKWKIGKVLGSGACATVCALKYIKDGSTSETDYAVKLAPLAKKKTKKGNSIEEMNAKLLYYEQLVYTTQFRTLQGIFIPSAPSSSPKDPPIYGDESGTLSWVSIGTSLDLCTDFFLTAFLVHSMFVVTQDIDTSSWKRWITRYHPLSHFC